MSKKMTRSSVSSRKGTRVPSSSGKVTKDMTFAELIMDDEEVAEKLFEKGLFCGGCPMAQFETIEQGAQAHGMDVAKLVDELNSENKK